MQKKRCHARCHGFFVVDCMYVYARESLKLARLERVREAVRIPGTVMTVMSFYEDSASATRSSFPRRLQQWRLRVRRDAQRPHSTRYL